MVKRKKATYKGLKGRKRVFKDLGWKWNDTSYFTSEELAKCEKLGWFFDD